MNVKLTEYCAHYLFLKNYQGNNSGHLLQWSANVTVISLWMSLIYYNNLYIQS